MNSSRRGFLAMLLGTATTATLDPEKLLWVPGKRLISIPKPPTPFLLCPKGIYAVKMRILMEMDAYIESPLGFNPKCWLDEAAFAGNWEPGYAARSSRTIEQNRHTHPGL